LISDKLETTNKVKKLILQIFDDFLDSLPFMSLSSKIKISLIDETIQFLFKIITTDQSISDEIKLDAISIFNR